MSTIDVDCTEGGSKVHPCDAASHELTAYKSALNENFYNTGRQAVVQSFAVLVSGTSLFIAIKYTKLIRNKFSHQNINLD